MKKLKLHPIDAKAVIDCIVDKFPALLTDDEQISGADLIETLSTYIHQACALRDARKKNEIKS